MAGVAWREHAGQPYLDVDYRGCDGPDMLTVARASVDDLERAPECSLVLVDITDATVDRDWLYYVRGANNAVMGPKRLRTAVVGVTGVKAAMFRGFLAASSVKARPFPTREKALAWLVAQ